MYKRQDDNDDDDDDDDEHTSLHGAVTKRRAPHCRFTARGESGIRIFSLFSIFAVTAAAPQRTRSLRVWNINTQQCRSEVLPSTVPVSVGRDIV